MKSDKTRKRDRDFNPKFTGSKVKPYYELVKNVLIQAVRDGKLTPRVREVYGWLYWELKELKYMEDERYGEQADPKHRPKGEILVK